MDKSKEVKRRRQFLYFVLLAAIAFNPGCQDENNGFSTRVSVTGNKFYFNDRVINPGSPAEGLLMNVRMVNSVFEDRGQELAGISEEFDPELNTDRFIEKIPGYVANGINAFTISLQGGMPGYEGAVNSAFDSDGNPGEEYLQRVKKVITACDQNNAAVILSLFYQRQHSHHSSLSGRISIMNAVENTVNWITEEGFKNVILEISNEYRHGGFRNWPDGEWLMSEAGQRELILLAKELNPELLVSTSGMGNGIFPGSLAEVADFLLIHFNTTSLDLYPERIEELKKYNKPIVCNEDDKIGPEGAAAQAISVMNGCGWGYMGLVRNQHFPFEYLGIDDDPDVYLMYRNITSPGYQIDPESLQQTSITINYPHDGEIFLPGQSIEINLSHLYPEETEAFQIELLANDKTAAVIQNRLRLRVNWQSDEPGIYIFQAVVKDEAGDELYRSAEVDIIIE
jgi:hypothetical protein